MENKSMKIRKYRFFSKQNLFIVIFVVATLGITHIITSMQNNNSFAESNNSFPIEIRFLNTFNNPEDFPDGNPKGSNASSLIKTLDGKYVLVDTGIKNKNIVAVIKKALKKYQNKTTGLVIDYLIVSHLDPDHYGNASAIIDDKDVNVKNVVVKYDSAIINANSTRKNAYDGIVKSAKTEKASLYTNAASYKVDGEAVKNYAKYNALNAEGTGNAIITIGQYLKLYFYNTKDVFSSIDVKNDPRCKKAYSLIYTRNVNNENLLKDKNGNYLRFDNRNDGYPNIKFEKTKELKKEGKQFSQFWYASIGGDNYNTCFLPNSNSYGILAEVKTDVGNKYVYFPNDIENFGYNFLIPTSENITYYSSTQKKNVTKKHTIYGSSQRLTTNNANEIYGYANFDGKTLKKVGEITVPSETKVALEIADKLGDKLNDLVIYQMSHHGINNVPDVVETLNLNRSSLFAVANAGSDDYSHFGRSRSYFYSMKKSNRLFAGLNQGDGVFCAISKDGKAKCGYDEIKINTINYNLNSSTSAIAPQSCLSTKKTGDSCSIKITNTKPTRSGYQFLGWASSKDATESKYPSGQQISIQNDLTLYAVWAPIYTVNYDTKGGEPALESQTCSPTTTNGSCTITIPTTTENKEHYQFFGWSKSSTDTSSSYSPGSKISIKANTTLYAVWQRLININTSVNGSGGKITPSISDIATGSTVTVIFTPNSGYEIDNVKLDEQITEVSENRLEIIAGDSDISVIVTYKLINPDDPPEPTYNTFHIYFSSNNGGIGFPDTISCTTTAESPTTCLVQIPETPPTRDKFTFLGYNTYENRNTASYYPNSTYELTDDLYLVGVWAPIYTLHFDTNGGIGDFANLTCYPNELAIETCSVNISTIKPTKDQLVFLGWAISDDAKIPEYYPGNVFTFLPNQYDVTLYTVWNNGSIEWQQAQEYVIGSDLDMILKINYPLESFVSLEIDGSIVDKTNYTLSQGSTIIAISSDYANTIPTGEHTLIVNYQNGVSAVTTFTITSNEEPDDPDNPDEDPDDPSEDDPDNPDTPDNPNEPENPTTPDTGSNIKDNTNLFSIISIIPIVFLGIIFIAKYAAKTKNSHRIFD